MFLAVLNVVLREHLGAPGEERLDRGVSGRKLQGRVGRRMLGVLEGGEYEVEERAVAQLKAVVRRLER